MDLEESFKILKIKSTTDKRKVKEAYSKLLKKYHPEEYPDLFITINGAYRKIMEYINKSEISYSQNISKSFEKNGDFGKNTYYFFNDEYYENIMNEMMEISLDSQNIEEYILSISEWISNTDEKNKKYSRTIHEWKKIIRKYVEDFNEEEKENIVKRIREKYGKNLRYANFTDFERELFLYVLVRELNNDGNYLFKTYENSEKSAMKEVLEEIIERYFNIKKIKILKLFEILEATKNENLETEFNKIEKLVDNLEIEKKNNKKSEFILTFTYGLAIIVVFILWLKIFSNSINLTVFQKWFVWIGISIISIFFDYFYNYKNYWTYGIMVLPNIVLILGVILFLFEMNFSAFKYVAVLIIISIIRISNISKYRYNKIEKYLEKILNVFLNKRSEF